MRRSTCHRLESIGGVNCSGPQPLTKCGLRAYARFQSDGNIREAKVTPSVETTSAKLSLIVKDATRFLENCVDYLGRQKIKNVGDHEAVEDGVRIE